MKKLNVILVYNKEEDKILMCKRKKDPNKLYWVDKDENFFDINKYAGEGNIGHMVQQVEIYKDKLF